MTSPTPSTTTCSWTTGTAHEVPEDTVDEVLAVLGEGEVIPVANVRFEDSPRHAQTDAYLTGSVPEDSSGQLIGVGVATPEVLAVLDVPSELRDALDAGEAIAVTDQADGVTEATITNNGGTNATLPFGGSFDSPAASYGLPQVLISAETAEEHGLVEDRPRILVDTGRPITDDELDELALLADDIAWNAQGARADEFVSVYLPDPEPAITEAQVRVIVYAALMLVIGAVVAVGLALAAKDSEDEARVLVAVGAPPRTVRRVAALRAGLLVATATAIALPAGLLPAWAITSASSDGRLRVYDGGLVPFRLDVVSLVFLVVAVPVIVMAVALAGTWLRDHLRRTRPLRLRPRRLTGARPDLTGASGTVGRRGFWRVGGRDGATDPVAGPRPRRLLLAPDGGRHRRVGQPEAAEHGHDPARSWPGPRSTAPTVHPVNPNRDTIDGRPCLSSIDDVPDDIDLAVILVGDAVDAFEEVLAKEPRFAVIFAAGFAETGAGGRGSQARLERLVAAGDTHLLGPNTNLNAFESFTEGNPGRSRRPHHPERAPGPTDLPGPGPRHARCRTGRRPATRSTSSSPTSPAGSPTSPRSGVVAAYIEGFKDGRTLMLAADHAAQRGVPIVVVKVGRTDEGASMAPVPHRPPHRLRRRDLGRVPPVRRHPGRRPRRAPGHGHCCCPGPRRRRRRRLRLRHLRRHRRPHGRPRRGRRTAPPRPHPRRPRTALREWIPGYLRVSNPVDNGGRPVGGLAGPQDPRRHRRRPRTSTC